MSNKIEPLSQTSAKKPIVALDPTKMLGFSQLASVTGKQKELGKLMNKVGEVPVG